MHSHTQTRTPPISTLLFDSLLPSALWYFAPPYLTRALLWVYLRIQQHPPPPPRHGSPKTYKTLYKRMLILIVLVLSLYDLTSTYRALVGKETLYKLLNGLPISATEKEVKREWRRMSLIYHPDVAAGVGVAKSRLKEIEDRFMQMKEAYEVLGNPVKRFAYDRFGVEGLWMTTAKQQQTPAGGPAVPGALVAPPPGSVAGVVWLGTFEVSQRYFAKLGAWGLWIWMMSWGKWGGDSRYFQQCAILRRLVFLCGHIFEHICAATAAERGKGRAASEKELLERMGATAEGLQSALGAVVGMEGMPFKDGRGLRGRLEGVVAEWGVEMVMLGDEEVRRAMRGVVGGEGRKGKEMGRGR
ncbi:DnaJ-domain-containing protein [Terfezia boudieri ATCC MYA-4762]|uniref:DnaJ-domain-containing protein n=1 Tax=Terfezia boudieri ATCC MYA-4762 TaxID=1051890 RepID=A0A3N4M0Y9_9PEZI|nr:DnaJ-domain-containing protein [Terfezia boudieri ATCC MYA-4762]